MTSQEEVFKDLVLFAIGASQQVEKIDLELFDIAIGFGEAQLKPGISLDDALEIENVLRKLRALKKYREALKPAPVVDERTNGGSTDEGDRGRTHL